MLQKRYVLSRKQVEILFMALEMDASSVLREWRGNCHLEQSWTLENSKSKQFLCRKRTTNFFRSALYSAACLENKKKCRKREFPLARGLSLEKLKMDLRRTSTSARRAMQTISNSMRVNRVTAKEAHLLEMQSHLCTYDQIRCAL